MEMDATHVTILSLACFFVIHLFKSPSQKQPLPWKLDLRWLTPWFWKELSSYLLSWADKSRNNSSSWLHAPSPMPKKKDLTSQVENVELRQQVSLLDLTELALDGIFSRLSPAELCTAGLVCTSLRDRCRCDRLWEKHMERKWGGVIGHVAYREWQRHMASKQSGCFLGETARGGLFLSLLKPWPFSWLKPRNLGGYGMEKKSPLPANSVMALYLSIESGKFWFPAQVFNRENGHAGFMLSCYDARLSYDSCTDTFFARYSHGRHAVEENIHWDRVRAPPIDASPHATYVSDSLGDLKPGDHIEIQWRRNGLFSYGWWYGVIGHLESCDGNPSHCHCCNSDKVVLEFNQYKPGSRWHRKMIARRDHFEEGNRTDGFYGGIRKINKEKVLWQWKRLWPAHVLE